MALLLTSQKRAAFLLLTGMALSTFLSLSAEAGRIADADWNQGVVVLSNDEVLSGEVYHDHKNDLLLLRSGARQPIRTFTVHQLQSFRYYDPRDNLIRHFLTVALRGARTSYPVRRFYEVVSKGDVMYLRRHNGCALAPPSDLSHHTVAYDYFAYYQGQLIRSHRFEKDLLPVLANTDPTLLSYMKEKQLRPYEIADQIALITRFNRWRSGPVAKMLAPL